MSTFEMARAMRHEAELRLDELRAELNGCDLDMLVYTEGELEQLVGAVRDMTAAPVEG